MENITMNKLMKEIAKEQGTNHDLQMAMAINTIDLNELIAVVTEMKNHWVGNYLVRAYVSAYRGKKSAIDLRKFVSLDTCNQDHFIKILNMRNGWPYTDEQLYQAEQILKRIVGIK